MSLKTSTGLRNRMLDTAPARTVLEGGFIHIYGGVEPVSADAAIDSAGNPLLCTIYSDGLAAGLNLAATATDGMIQKAAGESWTGSVIVSGVATFFRHVGAGDSGALSTTEPRMQGKVAMSGGELNISATGLIAGAPQAINFYSLALPTF